jgi:hypothetical protein
MPLILHRREFGEDQFSIFDGERYVGRLYKTARQGWYWGLDPFTFGLIRGHEPTSTRALEMLKAAWDGVQHARLRSATSPEQPPMTSAPHAEVSDVRIIS